MEAILILTVCTLLNVACFLIGAKVGQKVDKGEGIDISLPDPFKPLVQTREKRKTEREVEAFNTILHNVDVYDGTSIGQKDVM